MSTYPLQIRRLNMSHRGGTKFYNLMQVTSGDGNSICFFRWGANGKFGETQVFCGTEASMQTKFQAKQREKQGRGYANKDALKASEAADAEQFARLMTPAVMSKLGPAALVHLDPKWNVAGMREPGAPRFNEDGDYLGEPAPLSVPLDEEALRLETEALRKAENAGMAENELWGKF